MAFSLFRSTVLTNTNVSFQLLDKKGSVIDGYTDYACFSPITYRAIPAACTSIVVHRSLSRIPYKKVTISKWINELNVLGFPCSVTFDKKDEEAIFTIDLSRFTYKMHVSCMLQLIRCLFESGICLVPELYFTQFAAKATTLDEKWMALQDAHKAIHDEEGRVDASYREAIRYANTNHMVTYRGNGANIERAAFWKNIEETKHLVYSENIHN